MRKRQAPSVSKDAKEKLRDKLVLVRKLRWQGREEEAKKLWDELAEEEKVSCMVPENLFTD